MTSFFRFAPRAADHRPVFAAFAAGLARVLTPRRSDARVRPLGDAR